MIRIPTAAAAEMVVLLWPHQSWQTVFLLRTERGNHWEIFGRKMTRFHSEGAFITVRSFLLKVWCIFNPIKRLNNKIIKHLDVSVRKFLSAEVISGLFYSWKTYWIALNNFNRP